MKTEAETYILRGGAWISKVFRLWRLERSAEQAPTTVATAYSYIGVSATLAYLVHSHRLCHWALPAVLGGIEVRGMCRLRSWWNSRVAFLYTCYLVVPYDLWPTFAWTVPLDLVRATTVSITFSSFETASSEIW